MKKSLLLQSLWKVLMCQNNRSVIASCDFFCINEPPHDKTSKMACAPSKASDRPRLPPSLIRVFAVSMKKA